MELTKEFFAVLPTKVKYEITKHFTIFKDEGNKKACFSGKRIQLTEFNSDFGKNFVEVSEEQAKLKHLGKMRCVGNVSCEYELLKVFACFFYFEMPQSFTPVIVQKNHEKKQEKIKQPIKKEIKVENAKLNQSPEDRDEKELVTKYRQTTNKREKDKIFSTILFKRGVKGKSWDQIIRNYISFNKFKFAAFQDRNENDFYQEILMAFHKQIEKWYKVEKNTCFSTYAYYVINCAFNRVLQSLSTKKRKSNNANLNIDLDDTEMSWDESISIEKTEFSHSNFEEEFDKANLCSHIEQMFELKHIDAPEELKQELLSNIRNKSTIQNSLFLLSKKYNVSVEQLFVLEKDLRDNLKNAMFNDIILNIKYEKDSDEDIAKKYKRSKGHVIKMKKHIQSIVQSKFKKEVI